MANDRCELRTPPYTAAASITFVHHLLVMLAAGLLSLVEAVHDFPHPLASMRFVHTYAAT